VLCTDYPCAARLGVARRNSLRSLRELRSNNRRESEGTKRASRADPEAALLGAADIAPAGGAPSALARARFAQARRFAARRRLPPRKR